MNIRNQEKISSHFADDFFTFFTFSMLFDILSTKVSQWVPFMRQTVKYC